MSAQKTKTVSLYAGTTDANPASRYLDCSQAHRVKIVCSVAKGEASLTSFTLEEATSDAGAGLQNLARTVPLWVNLNAATNETQVRQTNAVTYALNNADDGRNQVVIFDVETTKLADGFRFLRVQTAAGNALNLGSITAELELRESVA